MIFIRQHNPKNLSPNTTELSDLTERPFFTCSLIDRGQKEFELVRLEIQALREGGSLASESFLTFGKQK